MRMQAAFLQYVEGGTSASGPRECRTSCRRNVGDASLQLGDDPTWPAGTTKEAHMSRVTALFVGFAALTVISTVAEAKDGCGRGYYYNGRRCVPQHDADYRPHHRSRGSSVDLGPNVRLHLGEGSRYRSRHYDDHPRGGVSVDLGPGMRLHLGHGSHRTRHHDDE